MPPKTFLQKHKGFTLVEVLITVVVVLILGLAVANGLGAYTARNAADSAERQLRVHLRKAQLYAMTGRNGDSWGIYHNNGSVTLYRGSTYASRNTAFDEKVFIPNAAIITTSTGVFTEMRFSKTTGMPTVVPSATFPVSIVITAPTTTRTITVTSEGSVLGDS